VLPHPSNEREKMMAENLKTHIKTLLHGNEIRQLQQSWIKRLTEAGVDEGEAHQWVAEINHVIDAYELSLLPLVDLFQEHDQKRILRETESWAALTRDITVFKIEDAMGELLKRLNKYLPPEPDDEDGEI
jgi:hypothetical protein